MAKASEESLPSYHAACADAPPPYIQNAKLVEAWEFFEDQSASDINSLPYSKLEYAQRDAASPAPDIYFDRKFVSKVVDDNAEDMFVKSDKDGLTYCYSLIKISNGDTLMDRFLSAIRSRSKSADAKAKRCKFIRLDTHVVFRYMLTTSCQDRASGLKRQHHFVDFEDSLLPKEALLSAKAKTIYHEAGSSLSKIRRKNLCHETIRHISRKFLQYHERIIPTRHCRFRHQVQTAEIFPLQVVRCTYNGKDFKFFSIGESGSIYFPSQYCKTISILKPLMQS